MKNVTCTELQQNQALLPSLKVEGWQNNWQWAAGGPCEQAGTGVEKENNREDGKQWLRQLKVKIILFVF